MQSGITDSALPQNPAAVPPAVPPPLARSLLHSGIEVRNFVSLEVLAAIFPLSGGFMLYGWRAMGVTVTIVLSTLVAGGIWKNIGWRGRQMRVWHCLWMAVVLSLMLPAHLFSTTPLDGLVLWPILPSAGIILVMVIWLLGGMGAQRIQPTVVTLLLLFAVFHDALMPRYVLRADRLFWGDLLKVNTSSAQNPERGAWMVVTRGTGATHDSLFSIPAADRLIAYTAGQLRPERSTMTPQMLIRDQLPPLEDLIIGGQSAAIGNGSAVCIIIGGLFLLYRGLIDWRLPLLATLSAMLALLVLPIPVVITSSGAQFRWFAFRSHYLGWPVAITLMNYELLASPLLLTIFFLANAPGLRPITRRGRAIFAITLGLLSAGMQLYIFVSVGPYIALLVASLLTPTLDRLHRAKPLV
jgi:Na+-translocating ferredoxin:NAD+ oxidoreductase RnfD subunit